MIEVKKSSPNNEVAPISKNKYESMNKLYIFMTGLPSRLKRRIQDKVQNNIYPTILAGKVTITFPWRPLAKPHGLAAPLIISLTSYPARFGKLPLTLKCLLSQSIKADRVILWIAHEDKSELTPAILDLQKIGLEIAYCDNFRSFKKIIPTLQLFPNSFIATADDDLYYWSTWLAEMVQGYKNNSREVKLVVCHRAHQIQLGGNKLPLPYAQWETETQRLEASPLVFQTGVGGVLYPPGIFHRDVLEIEVFNKLCPNGDDIWLYWMMRLNGGIACKVGVRRMLYTWPDTQHTALFHNNTVGGGNDIQISAMIKNYNFP
ncbi:MAG: hypothetical protein Q7T48_22570 [Cellvibrio sp.]|uniref:hypothetical protein n=1 Tax=Cellvibrio sp. TaxID=1965322 RepID=UPI0027204DDF|nr:hypothetical protein [Cellvibrio sp.]